MKSFRNYVLVLSLATVSLFFALRATAQNEELPAEVGATCRNKQENAKNLGEKLKDNRVPQVCREEAKKQYEACGMPVPDDASGYDIANGNAVVAAGAKAQRDKLMLAAQKNTVKSKSCAAARDRAEEVCLGIRKDLRQALDVNARSEREEIAALVPGPARLAQQTEIQKRHRDVSLQLQGQISATDEFRKVANTALSDNSRCHADLARRDTFDAERANTVLAAASSDGPPGSADAPAVKPTEAAKPSIGERVISGGKATLENPIVDTAVTEVRNSAVRTALPALVNTSTAVGLVGDVFVGAPRGLLFGVGGGGLGILLASTGPAGGACDAVYKDALSADTAGCQVAVRQNIQSLGSNP